MVPSSPIDGTSRVFAQVNIPSYSGRSPAGLNAHFCSPLLSNAYMTRGAALQYRFPLLSTAGERMSPGTEDSHLSSPFSVRATSFPPTLPAYTVPSGPSVGSSASTPIS